MCASNENARLSESSSSPDSPPPSNAEVPTSQIEHSPMFQCPPLKDQPGNIPTISKTLLTYTLNEPSLAETAHSQMDEDRWSSVADVLQASMPPHQHQLAQAPAPSISHMTVPPPAAMERVTAGQPRRKPHATRLGRPPSVSRKSTSAGCQLKRRLEAHLPTATRNRRNKRDPVHPCASHTSSATQPLQPTIQPTLVPLTRSARAVVLNAIAVDPLE